MPQCVFKSCKNNARKSNLTAGVSYFRFPSNPFTCAEWISVVARERRGDFYKPAKNSVICSDHFDKSDISGNTNRRRLIKTAVPKLQNASATKTLQKHIMSTEVKKCGQMKYLTQNEAANLDQELFNEYKFSVDQLMELAGLSIATAVAKVYPPSAYQKALVICGPGNNGGDGLVAARHMVLFGYTVAVYYPKRTPKPLYENLLEQCKRFGVNIEDKLPPSSEINNNFKLIVDALFGFSFKPPVREELKPALDVMIDAVIPVCSVDIPSGWNVENGPGDGKSVNPSLLISLSAPKLCSRPEYLGKTKHFLGGRFLPPGIVSKYNLILPPYPQQDQVVELSC